MDEHKKKRGRPPKADATTHRGNVTVRMPDDLKARLAEAAERHGRSLSEEIHDRLEESIVTETRLGGREVANLSAFLASAMQYGLEMGAKARGFRDRNPDAWITDPFCYAAAAKAVEGALEARRPDQPDMTERQLELFEWAVGAALSGAKVNYKAGADT